MRAKRFISIIGTWVSLLCYVFTILLFTVRKEMNTVASMTLKILCGTLFIADTAFLIAIHLVYNKVACKLIAIVLHWALLSVQTWTAVMAFHILSKFRLVTLKQGKSNSRCFLEYSWLGYTLPSLILVVTVTLNETKLMKLVMEKVIHVSYIILTRNFISTSFTIFSYVRSTFCLVTVRFLSKRESKLRGWLEGSGRGKKI